MPRYYAMRVALDEKAAASLGGKKLVPGMPVELLIRRGDRTVLNFLVKPFSDRLKHVFREE
jgi:multidrug efflux pump subunit AcrA (membrane-fusion protein)